ncbi:LCP family protein [Romboutsia sedimentorum]|uniref:LCP family protein n=1 Tax=Romboutsia sedimentorum TaxID=1368474 RepID=A0ABT7E8K7_9FIRM|nr:LCP family protein [Romboutsia sedimentorum]MDK2563253.1 LCP family protein [Romboutsia sedimentorum]MDK2584980.1 LCP family protein [Romboutsia sedimentorum]
MKKLIPILLSILITLILIPNIYALEDDTSYEVLKQNQVDNILLIGRDSLKSKGPARSDSMIILTVDNLNKSLKLTSLARDTLVDIPNIGQEKLNHAYAYGQEKLLLKTINQNFKLDIKDYAVVDFTSFVEIIDILGGVDVDVNEKEVKHLNQTIKTCYSLNDENKGKIKYVNNSGNQSLNGYQALAYARIRKIDTIYKRDERQRKILTSVATKLSNTSITKYPAIVKNVLKHVDVNISLDKITRLAFLSHELASYDMKQLQFPLEKYREEGRINGDGLYVVRWKEDENLKVLHEFIYGR